MTSPVILERNKALLDELTVLSKQQSDALQISAYSGMPPAIAKEYDDRAKRIAEIRKLLGVPTLNEGTQK